VTCPKKNATRGQHRTGASDQCASQLTP